MFLTTLHFLFATMVLATFSLADVLVTDIKQIQNLDIVKVESKNHSNQYQLTLVYTQNNKILGTANLSCDSRSACKKLKKQIYQALSNGKSVEIHFDKEKTIAKIFDQPTLKSHIDSSKLAVCKDSDPRVIALSWSDKSQGVGFEIRTLDRITVPSNTKFFRLNANCTIEFRETLAQQWVLKPRKILTFVAEDPYRYVMLGPNGGMKVTFCYGINLPSDIYLSSKTFGFDSYSCVLIDSIQEYVLREARGNYSSDSLNAFFSKTVHLKTPLDEAIDSIYCTQNFEHPMYVLFLEGGGTKFDVKTMAAEDEKSNVMSFWSAKIEEGGGAEKGANIAETSVGEPKVCSKPIER